MLVCNKEEHIRLSPTNQFVVQECQVNYKILNRTEIKPTAFESEIGNIRIYSIILLLFIKCCLPQVCVIF